LAVNSTISAARNFQLENLVKGASIGETGQAVGQRQLD